MDVEEELEDGPSYSITKIDHTQSADIHMSVPAEFDCIGM
jgi:hypothetical protein